MAVMESQSLVKAVGRQFERLHTWLLPPRCLVCDEAGADRRDLCAACSAALPRLGMACPVCALPLLADCGVTRCGVCQTKPSPLSGTHAPFLYAPPIDDLLRRFKFQEELAAGRLLSQLMVEHSTRRGSSAVLVPVPLHASRLRHRGYDQAAELAKPLARAMGIPCQRLLRRRTPTQAQSELDAEARRRNVRAAFECVAPVPDHVVLVDDVMTTGATLHSAARALRVAGAGKVEAWVCARVP